MNVLAIDPSTKSGYAILLDGSQHPVFGTWTLGEGLRAGQYFLVLTKEINALRVKYGIENQDLQIVIEDKAMNAVGTGLWKHLSESWLGVLETWCEGRRLSPPIAVGVNSWRSAFIGRSMAPKEVKGDAERRKWIKEAVMAECRRRGLTPSNDNESDAIGILFWFLVGGSHVQEQRRADKKARTAAKRAQKKLDLRTAA